MLVRFGPLVLVALAFGFAGCGDDDEPAGEPPRAEKAAAPKGGFVGKVSGTDAYIALVSDGTRLSGYVCDGKQISRWLQTVRLEGESAELRGRKGERVGIVTFAGGTADGSIEVAGRERTFTVEVAEREAGLYRAVKERRKDGKLGPGEVEVGWVVLADGSQRGVTNFITNQDTEVQPAPRLDPAQPDVTVQRKRAQTEIKVQQAKIETCLQC